MNKVTYTLNTIHALTVIREMKQTFIATGSRVYAPVTAAPDADYDYIVNPNVTGLAGDVMQGLLKSWSFPFRVQFVSQEYCHRENDTGRYPVSDDDRDSIVYLEDRAPMAPKINLIFVHSGVEFYAWLKTTMIMRDVMMKVESARLREKPLRVAMFRGCLRTAAYDGSRMTAEVLKSESADLVAALGFNAP